MSLFNEQAEGSSILDGRWPELILACMPEGRQISGPAGLAMRAVLWQVQVREKLA